MNISLKFKWLISVIAERLIGYKSQGKINQELKDSGMLTIGDHTYQWQMLNIDIYAGSEAKVIIGKF